VLETEVHAAKAKLEEAKKEQKEVETKRRKAAREVAKMKEILTDGAGGRDGAEDLASKKKSLEQKEKTFQKKSAMRDGKVAENKNLALELEKNFERDVAEVIEAKCREKRAELKATDLSGALKSENEGMRSRIKNLEKLIAEEKKNKPVETAKKGRTGSQDGDDF